MNAPKRNIRQLLSDTGINPFAADLLAESYRSMKPEMKERLPKPLVFTIKNVQIQLSDSPDVEERIGKEL